MTDVKEYFKSYPKSDECFQTSDGFIFHKSHDAQTHGNTLKDKKIQKYERGANTVADAAEKKAAAEKAAAEKAAKEAAAEKKGSVPKMQNPPKPPSSKKK